MQIKKLYRLLLSLLFKDKRPPVIHNCPRTIEAVADRNATTTRITWQPPFATDNYDDNISITIVGREPGSIFHESAESYYVEYNAVDAAGNRAVPCSFAIRVFSKYSSNFRKYSSNIFKYFTVLCIVVCSRHRIV